MFRPWPVGHQEGLAVLCFSESSWTQTAATAGCLELAEAASPAGPRSAGCVGFSLPRTERQTFSSLSKIPFTCPNSFNKSPFYVHQPDSDFLVYSEETALPSGLTCWIKLGYTWWPLQALPQHLPPKGHVGSVLPRHQRRPWAHVRAFVTPIKRQGCPDKGCPRDKKMDSHRTSVCEETPSCSV